MDDKRLVTLLLLGLAAVVILVMTASGAMAAELGHTGLGSADERAAWRAASCAAVAGLGLFGLLGARRG